MSFNRSNTKVMISIISFSALLLNSFSSEAAKTKPAPKDKDRPNVAIAVAVASSSTATKPDEIQDLMKQLQALNKEGDSEARRQKIEALKLQIAEATARIEAQKAETARLRAEAAARNKQTEYEKNFESVILPSYFTLGLEPSGIFIFRDKDTYPMLGFNIYAHRYFGNEQEAFQRHHALGVGLQFASTIPGKEIYVSTRLKYEYNHAIHEVDSQDRFKIFVGASVGASIVSPGTPSVFGYGGLTLGVLYEFNKTARLRVTPLQLDVMGGSGGTIVGTVGMGIGAEFHFSRKVVRKKGAPGSVPVDSAVPLAPPPVTPPPAPAVPAAEPAQPSVSVNGQPIP